LPSGGGDLTQGESQAAVYEHSSNRGLHR